MLLHTGCHSWPAAQGPQALKVLTQLFSTEISTAAVVLLVAFLIVTCAMAAMHAVQRTAQPRLSGSNHYFCFSIESCCMETKITCPSHCLSRSTTFIVSCPVLAFSHGVAPVAVCGCTLGTRGQIQHMCGDLVFGSREHC